MKLPTERARQIASGCKPVALQLELLLSGLRMLEESPAVTKTSEVLAIALASLKNAKNIMDYETGRLLALQWVPALDIDDDEVREAIEAYHFHENTDVPACIGGAYDIQVPIGTSFRGAPGKAWGDRARAILTDGTEYRFEVEHNEYGAHLNVESVVVPVVQAAGVATAGGGA